MHTRLLPLVLAAVVVIGIENWLHLVVDEE